MFKPAILLSIIMSCANATASTSIIQTNIENIKAKTVELSKQDKFSGAILIASDKAVNYAGAFGLASKRFNVENKLNTKFNLGSTNKMFTAVAIMQLVEKKQLSLSDKLSDFVDETWLDKSISEKIEIRHLLSHTSGLGSYFGKEFINASRAKYRYIKDYKPLVQKETLEFEPGQGYHYSNTGMLMLGLVIEAVSNKSYFEYVNKHIFEPAGMLDSGSYDMDFPVNNLAIGYMPSKNKTGWRNNLFMHVIKGGPAGGGFSTVEDMHRFALALTHHKLLNKKNTEILLSAKPEMNAPEYGFGFRIWHKTGHRVVGHDGAFPGIDAYFAIDIDTKDIVVILANYGRSIAPILETINGKSQR